jgi:integrating conjugative element protein (TIGR03757 family)
MALMAWANEREYPQTIELFVDSTFPEIKAVKNATVYRLDRIHVFQENLSRNLPSDPDDAKTLVLQRFQGMDRQLSRDLENAAKGLVKAMNYGIDRYPAVVFDGRAVVYGVTDLDAAADHYRQWAGQGAR